MRTLLLSLSITLAGCSLAVDDIKPPAYVPPAPPSPEAQLTGANKSVKDEQLTGAIQISDLRIADRGLGRYMICLRGRRGDAPINYYAVFFDGDEYKGVRLSVIYDFCEQQSFRPLG